MRRRGSASSWTVADPYAGRIAGDRRQGRATTRRRWPREILAIDTIFDPRACGERRIPAGDRRRARRLAVGPSRWPMSGASAIARHASAAKPRAPAGRPERWGGGHEAWSSDGAVSGHAARARSRTGRAASGFEALEIACWPKSAGPSRRYAGTSHIDVARLSASQAKEIVAALTRKRPRDLGARLLPQSAASRSCASPDRHRSPEEGHRRGRPDGRRPWSTPSAAAMRRSTVDANWQEALKVWPDIIAHAARQRRQAGLRELPDDLQL